MPLLSCEALRFISAARASRAEETGSLADAELRRREELLEQWRAQGGKTALATASNQKLAEDIAAHLGVFDEVHGSTDTANLKGKHKAAFLASHFGDTPYAYMADSSADIPVWENAAKSITVDASPSLKNSVEAIAQDVEHIGAPAAPARHMLRALRPHQWLKNLLVFVPMLAAHQMTADNALTSLSAFVAFCLVASSVYVLNDLLDLAADRAHPRKKERPFASGRLHIAHGTWLAPVLFLAGFLIALAAGKQLAAVVLLYFIVTTAYSLYLKRLLILDICTLAGLYTLRVIGGGAATGIPLSIWLLAFSIFFFFALATIKRQAELLNGVEEGKEKALGRGYHVNDLPTVANMATASGYMSIMILSLYLNSLNVQELYASPSFLWGICLVLLYWFSRVLVVTNRGDMHDDPIVFALKDRVSHACLLLILAFTVMGAFI